ncbi:MAG: hypothetical protein V2I27_15615 [Erythrobacter sp.]|nr:hypothetical protein [Erythrobacter sp.]
MSTLDWTLIALIICGVIVPNAMIAYGVLRAGRRDEGLRARLPSQRYFAYAQLLRSLRDQMDLERRQVANGPLFIATLRELKEYPEYRALTLLFIEEITITGKKKFDDVARTELQSVENALLEAYEIERD